MEKRFPSGKVGGAEFKDASGECGDGEDEKYGDERE